MRRSLKCFFMFGLFMALSWPGCKKPAASDAILFNRNAVLSGDLPANPLEWRVVTSTLDRSGSQMATLFGDDLAVDYARSHAQPDYPTGSILCLVTWSQREDPRWFGAAIPDRATAVEFVNVANGPNGAPENLYQRYEGSPLKQVPAVQQKESQERTAYILGLRAAVMP